jgi:hypothetical protein
MSQKWLKFRSQGRSHFLSPFRKSRKICTLADLDSARVPSLNVVQRDTRYSNASRDSIDRVTSSDFDSPLESWANMGVRPENRFSLPNMIQRSAVETKDELEYLSR